jgi:hypothetical protein
MRFHLTIIAVALFASCSADGAIIPGIYNTGVNSLGNLLAPGNPDPHYTLTSEPVGSPTVALVTAPNVNYNEPNGPISNWISPNADDSQNLPVGYYNYRSTLDLTGFNPATVVLTGQAYVDDNLTIIVNGVAQASTASFQPTPFTLSGAFVPGINIIDYSVYNAYVPPLAGGASPSALRVEISGTGSVPEPALLSLSGFIIALFRRKRRNG